MTRNKAKQVAVVGVDFSVASDEAIFWGLRWLGESSERTLHLFHVLDPRDVIDDAEVPALLTTEHVIADAPDLLRQRVEAMSFSAQVAVDRERVRTHARVGNAVDTLLQACIDYEADVLVVGTHGRKGFERMLLGSVSEQLVRRARCPVVIARLADYEGCKKTELPDAPYEAGDPRGHGRRSQPPHESIVSTESAGWNPSDSGPTGFRIV
jgi:nucleotide-binding universal stress UspA family protein